MDADYKNTFHWFLSSILDIFIYTYHQFEGMLKIKFKFIMIPQYPSRKEKGKIQAAPASIVYLSINDVHFFPVTRTDMSERREASNARGYTILWINGVLCLTNVSIFWKILKLSSLCNYSRLWYNCEMLNLRNIFFSFDIIIIIVQPGVEFLHTLFKFCHSLLWGDIKMLASKKILKLLFQLDFLLKRKETQTHTLSVP